MPCDESDQVIHEALHQLRDLSSSKDDAAIDFAAVVANDLHLMSPNNAEKLISDILFLGKLGKLSSNTKIIE